MGGACGAMGVCACAGTTPDNCSGTCTNLQTDHDHCGTCPTECSVIETCRAGVCVSEPSHQVSPPSLSKVTSSRPTLRWSNPTGQDGARVQLCRDRACTMIDTTTEITGTSYRPATALAQGVHYWRLLGKAGTVFGTTWSPAWEFFVGAGASTIDTTSGTMPDFNGDGYADVAIGAPYENSYVGVVHIFSGSAAGIGATTASTRTSPGAMNATFGYYLANGGDVNGDGFGDLLVYRRGVTPGITVLLGSAAGLATTGPLVPPPAGSDSFGLSFASAGDINHDGYGDVLIGAPGTNSNDGVVYVYLGSATGLPSAPSSSIPGTAGAGRGLGSSVIGAGDLNGDGFSDVVIGARSGNARVHLGSASGLSAVPNTTLASPDGAADFGGSANAAGDFNGDGYSDVAFSAPSYSGYIGRAYVFHGGATGLPPTPAVIITGTDGPSTYFSLSISNGGDVNRDGCDDLFVTVPNAARSYIFYGSASGLSASSNTRLSTSEPATAFYGTVSAGAGDVNGDGYADVLVGVYGGNSNTGRFYLYPGSATGLTASTAIIRDGAVASGRYGTSVASLDDLFGRLNHASAWLFGAQPSRRRFTAFDAFASLATLPSRALSPARTVRTPLVHPSST